ncbi:glycerophosphodiester phosphodiesterase [Martelella soudanensis]|uniref:glycerophosphodiester phosphodiesterase n=1 Tax=unclassified Martelella TaxID=2629616 RepID=UPI0015DFC28B|nr:MULTISPECIES: glycerophosphodiester phosphodiesterase family protein [unclassified Martelella]
MSDMQGLHLELNGRKTRLKWHQLRKRVADPTFSLAVMTEGFEIGASMELDLRVRADGGFAVVHDDTLESETDARGLVSALTRDDLASIRYAPGGEPLILSEDLGRLLRSAHPDALLQFDMKSDLDEVGEAGIAHLGQIIGANTGNIIISATDLDLIAAMRETLPAVARGIDPSEDIAEAWLKDGFSAARDVLDAALAGPTGAGTIYLHYPLVLKAADSGLDMIAACHDAGMLVDAWTFNPAHPEHGLAAGELETVRRLLELGADQITTDEAPALEAAWRAAREPASG